MPKVAKRAAKRKGSSRSTPLNSLRRLEAELGLRPSAAKTKAGIEKALARAVAEQEHRRKLALRRAKDAARRAEAKRKAEELHRKRILAAKRGIARRREEQALTPLFERLQRLKDEGADHTKIRSAHATWYDRKEDTRDTMTQRDYALIVERVARASGVDDFQPYIDS
jgi:hypothetical protein